MAHRRSVTVALLALLAVGTSGCSWIFVDGPPEDHAELEFFTCTTSRAAPRLDLVWGGLNVLGIVVASAETSEEFEADSDGITKEAFIATSAAWTVVAGLSARSGFQRVNACEEAIRQRGARGASPAVRPTGGTGTDVAPGAGAEPGPGPIRTAPAPSWSAPMLFPVSRPGS